MIIVSFPATALALEPSQYETVVFTKDDGVTTSVDIDELLNELLFYNRGRQSCEELELLISRIKNHQLSGNPLYVTTWRIYDNNDAHSRTTWRGRYTEIRGIAFTTETFPGVPHGAGWIIRNTHWHSIHISATGRLFRNNSVIDQGSFAHNFQPGDSRSMNLMSGPGWSHSTLTLFENNNTQLVFTIFG